VFLVGPAAPNLVELESKATEEIKRAGVARLVKLSAMGMRAATFPRQHAESEEGIKASGVAWTILRPNGFMQNMVIYNLATLREQDAFYGSAANGPYRLPESSASAPRCPSDTPSPPAPLAHQQRLRDVFRHPFGPCVMQVP
jgi:uncharacterized protein YbjT (DUF2867 family)